MDVDDSDSLVLLVNIKKGLDYSKIGLANTILIYTTAYFIYTYGIKITS